MNDIVDRLEGMVWEKDVTPLLAECAAEIRRLRLLLARKNAALAIVANMNNWDVLDLPEGVRSYEWQGHTEFADPITWATKERDATEHSE